MNQEIPGNIALGLSLGGFGGALFFLANLYTILHLIQRIFAPKAEWKWLNNLRNKWHYVHYFGNIAAFVVIVIHAVTLWQYATVFNWILIIVMAWMVFAGFTMRFTKAAPQFKKTIRKYHAMWYMLALVLVLIITAHVVSLSSFPYPVG